MSNPSPKQFKLKCGQCGETIICDESILDAPLECGECGYPIQTEMYPKLVELREQRKQAVLVQREMENRLSWVIHNREAVSRYHTHFRIPRARG